MREATRRPAGRMLGLLLLAAAAPGAGAAALEDRPAYLSRCETARIDAGRPEARWALLEGVYEDERDRQGRSFVWTARSWRARLLLTAGGERTLRLTGRRSPERLRLRAFWNGVDLGAREAPRGWTTLEWAVPARATRVGLNHLRFEASSARELERQLGFLLERIELEPSGPACGEVETTTAGRPFVLAPGSVVLVELPLALPRAALELELAGRPGDLVELHLSRRGRAQRRSELRSASGRRVERLAVDNLRSDRLVVVARGPGTIELRLLRHLGDERPGAWREACGLLWKEPLAAAALLALIALALAAGRRWPGGRLAPWLDCAVLLAVALALRAAFLEAYPAMDPKRFGDSWEYLKRARTLMRGASVWHDTGWHAWLSWIRPPGYYVLLAGVLGPLGGGLAMLAKIQAVLLAATAAAGYLIAYPLFGRGAALVTGLLLALYPQTITATTWILSDPLALFLTTAGLAGLSWLATRPSWPLALATGAVFGVACLVRSAPLYFVPLAAVILYLGQRAPRRRAPALVLAAATLLVVLPWCVRNSLIYGKPMGIDDLVIPNFLMAHPDPEILPEELDEVGVWGEGVSQVREDYFRRLWRANRDARLTRASGRILGRGLLRMAASPGRTLARFGQHLGVYFRPFPRLYAAHFLAEREGCRVTAWTDAYNLLYLPVALLALPGALLALRRRQSWPLIAWVVYFVVVTNLFFYPSYMPGRYRLPIEPALAALAAFALSRAGDALAALRARGRRPSAGG